MVVGEVVTGIGVHAKSVIFMNCQRDMEFLPLKGWCLKMLVQWCLGDLSIKGGRIF